MIFKEMKRMKFDTKLVGTLNMRTKFSGPKTEKNNNNSRESQ